ncbi:MAG: hypothetical protein AB8H80_11390 [Planctomycetota bacterium]
MGVEVEPVEEFWRQVAKVYAAFDTLQQCLGGSEGVDDFEWQRSVLADIEVLRGATVVDDDSVVSSTARVRRALMRSGNRVPSWSAGWSVATAAAWRCDY